MLVILDGWGIGPRDHTNAIAQAKTPCMDRILREYPNTELQTSGEDVGLPEGQMGNSEVGHINLGAGRIVWQDLARINKSIRDGKFRQEPVLLEAIQTARDLQKPLHLIGLVSDGGVHSHISHLEELLHLAHDEGVTAIYVHAFTDGRDTDPRSGFDYLERLDKVISETGGRLATIVGRYYAMDRDKRWERVKIAYDALVHRKGSTALDWRTAVRESYVKGITDEFIQPIILTENEGEALPGISPEDIVICFNFRTDRCREITEVLVEHDHPEQDMKCMPLHYATLTRYDDTYKNVRVVIEKNNLSMTMGEVLESVGKSQLRIAETEKYPHVTYFFSGGRERPFEGELRSMIASPKVATYDLKPEMSAYEVKDSVISSIEDRAPDFICLNFANADMVGHTGNFSAAVKAIESVDNCLDQVLDAGLKAGYGILVIADHGNADTMINADGSPNTAHTTHPVPCVFVSGSPEIKLQSGRLSDVAPTLLHWMHIAIPAEMTGKVLFINHSQNESQ
jgi:2,3-bisphosphoglycerate-independent phosphoglycerate mutase